MQQWRDEQPEAPWDIRIYPGADAALTLYDDDGNGYAYKRGAFAEAELRWNDAGRRLHLGAGRFRRNNPPHPPR